MGFKRLDKTDMEDISFWGFNTKTFKEALNNNKDITKNMTDTERAAYSLGVENILSLMEQTFNAGLMIVRSSSIIRMLRILQNLMYMS